VHRAKHFTVLLRTAVQSTLLYFKPIARIRNLSIIFTNLNIHCRELEDIK